MSMRTALMEMAQNQLDEVKSVDYGKRMTDAQKKNFQFYSLLYLNFPT